MSQVMGVSFILLGALERSWTELVTRETKPGYPLVGGLDLD